MDHAMEKLRLREYIEHESGALLGTLRTYLWRAGLAGRGEPLDAAANDLLNELIAEALAHEDRFDATRSPRAWLLGIAANLIKRRQTDLARRDRREPLLRDLTATMQDDLDDGELFDRVAALTALDIRQDAAIELLASVAPTDAQVLRLAVLNGLDGDSLARELGISPGAARVRLHRAIQRLRAAYRAQDMEDDDA
jgi:RNA polymerase sigma-70 factor (ECF subfamily)